MAEASEALSEVLAAVRRGDATAVRRLVERFEGPGRDLARALTPDAALAEDVLQDAFVAALANLDDLRDDGAFPAWFRQVVRTAANRQIRRRVPRLLGRDVDAPSERPSPEEELAREELERAVRDALARLADKPRRTAELFYLEGRGIREVAAALSVPEGTVKRRLHEARAQLRDLLLGAVGARDEGHAPGGGRPLL